MQNQPQAALALLDPGQASARFHAPCWEKPLTFFRKQNQLPAMTTLAPNTPTETVAGNHFVSNYPPFSCWTPEQLPALEAALDRPVTDPLSLYVHVPFCRQRCHYCYFRVHPRSTPAEVELYITRLLREFLLYQQHAAIHGRRFSTVYFGGGTPSYPSERQIERLFTGLRAVDDWDDVVECTCEVEPGTVSPEKYRLLSELGVTRLSIGFQTLDDHILRHIGRNMTVADCLAAYEQARAAGFDQINVDLLAGLPGETDTSWQRTVEQVLALQPDCVTIYQLELTHNSAMHATREAGRRLELPDWPTKIAWVSRAFEQLEAMGFTVASGYMAVRDPARWRFAYTADHFWRGEDLLALGETAFGHVQGVHYQNVHTFEAYTRRLADHRLPLLRAYELSDEEQFRREAILQLKTGALDATYFREKFARDLSVEFARPFRELIQRGYLAIDGDTYRLTREALLQVDWLLPALYLPQHRGVRYM